ncbi:MAG: DUF1573 domain-containing protein [Planctomycetes bacterium]|nr:DUF1573 domain-containing protein [Planctomycetota bacterium]
MRLAWGGIAIIGLSFAAIAASKWRCNAERKPVQGEVFYLEDGGARDFGKVPEWEILKTRFRIRNNSDETVVLNPVISKSCGCTEASLSNSRLPPGEETELHAQLSASNTRGQRRVVTATVAVVEPANAPGLVFHLSYSCEAQWSVVPNEIRISGHSGETVAAEFTVRSARKVDCDDLVVATTVPDARIRKSHPSVTDNEIAWKIEIDFPCPGSIGNKTYSVSTNCVNDPKSVLTAYINCRTLPRVRATPPVLHLVKSAEDSGVVFSGEVAISAAKDEDVIEIVEVISDEGSTLTAFADRKNSDGWVLSARRSVVGAAPRFGRVRIRYRIGECVEEVDVPFIQQDN